MSDLYALCIGKYGVLNVIYEYNIGYFPVSSGKFKNLSLIIFLSFYDIVKTYLNIIITFNNMKDIYIHTYKSNKYLIYHLTL